MSKRFSTFGTFTCLLLAVVVAVPAEARWGGGDFGTPDASAGRPTIAEIALGNEDFESLVVAVDRAGLVPTLLDPEAGPFTVFAPTDEAFDILLQEAGIDVAIVDVVDGNYTRSDLLSLSFTRSTLVTKGGLELEFRGTRVNGNRILVSNISAGNGTIFLIDGILLED